MTGSSADAFYDFLSRFPRLFPPLERGAEVGDVAWEAVVVEVEAAMGVVEKEVWEDTEEEERVAVMACC